LVHPTLFFLRGLAAAAVLSLAACAGTPEAAATPRKETVWAVTDTAELVRFNAGQPHKLQQRVALQGLEAGDKLVGIDFRVSRGVLYALSASGRLYTVDTKTGRLTAVGSAPPVVLQGERFGFDFNPAADRVRVVSDSGQNLRLRPDTGALAAADQALNWATPGRPAPRIAAAAYTYNKKDEKLTTNYAIDLSAGTLVMQGSLEGTQPAVSPNTGALTVVGPLGIGTLDAAALDIADIDNTALAALRSKGRTRLYVLDLATGRGTLLGTVGEGRALWGLAIEP
jgi:hypothetical protein